MKLDTLALVETPEGVDLHAETVGLVPRALAYSIDFCIRAGVIIVLSVVLLFMGKAGQGVLLIVYFLLEWWYPVVFEVYRGGQTIGKKLFSIKVVNEDLTPVQFGPSLIRNLLRVADFFPFFFIAGAISMLTTRRFQRLGDLAANTLVVSTQNNAYDLAALAGVKPVAPSFVLTESQQNAFINFALNRGQLSLARQSEIANIIQANLPPSVNDPVAYVRGVGKWLLGAR